MHMLSPLSLSPTCMNPTPLLFSLLQYHFASESCALATIGADFVREVAPGEIVRLDAEGIR